MDELTGKLQDLFRDVFDDPDLVLAEGMTAEDVDGWDSLAHINLIIAIERRLGIRFSNAEISQTKEPGSTVGSFLAIVRRKAGGTP